jgi:hypothetical protein
MDNTNHASTRRVSQRTWRRLCMAVGIRALIVGRQHSMPLTGGHLCDGLCPATFFDVHLAHHNGDTTMLTLCGVSASNCCSVLFFMASK